MAYLSVLRWVTAWLAFCALGNVVGQLRQGLGRRGAYAARQPQPLQDLGAQRLGARDDVPRMPSRDTKVSSML
jgi:hypothetical protein